MTPEGVVNTATPAAEAPPAAPPPAPPAAPPAVEQTPVGNWLMDLALQEDGQAAPAPAEAPKESAAPATEPPPAAPAEKPAEKPAEAPPAEPPPTQEAKPPAEGEDELTPEEKALIQSRPAAEQPELTRRFKTASFMGHYLDPTFPAENVCQHLEERSPSRYAEIVETIILKQAADPSSFADYLYRLAPQQYGQLALEVFNGDQNFFIKQLTGKDLDAAGLKAAAEAYNPAAAPPTNGAAPAGEPAFTKDELDDVRLYLGEDFAKKIEGLKVSTPPDNKELESLRKEVADLKGKAPEPPADPKEQEALQAKQEALRTQRDETWGSVIDTVEDFIGAYADDAKTGLGLKVTDEERKLAPEVATLKDIKRDIFINGIGDSFPYYEKGFGEWGMESNEFKQILAQALHYSEKTEKPNAVAAAQRLLPFADRYNKERLKHPVFQILDTAIHLMAARTNPKTTNDAIIPGAPVNSQSQPSDITRRIGDYLLNDALSVK